MVAPSTPEVSVEELTTRVLERLHAQRGALPPPSAVPLAWSVPVGVGAPGPDAVRTPADLAPYIDHTLLKPDARPADVRTVAEEARRHGFATVCVNSSYVPLAAEVLAGSRVVPIAVVGFPLGAALPAAKAAEAREALRLGAREIDTVVHVGLLRAGEYARVLEDLVAVVEAARPHPVKVILETALLTRAEKVAGCVLSKVAGAAYVKTSTGFGGGGATPEDVALMRQVVGQGVGVKASGAVRSADDALRVLRAGASRIGASASVAIITGKLSTASY